MKLKLFISTFQRNEFKSILGKRKTNFWILLVVFLCSIGALEFSRAGMAYLEEKMDDPFIKWVEISAEGGGRFEEFHKALEDTSFAIRSQYNIDTAEENFYLHLVPFNGTKMPPVTSRTIDCESRLLSGILAEENVVVPPLNPITSKDYGWIVTQRFMTRMGYEDSTHYPLFITIRKPGDTAAIAEWGLVDCQDGRDVTIPIPILAVVKQLPNLLDFMAPRMFYDQDMTVSRPFNYSVHHEYFDKLLFVVEDTAGVESAIKAILDEDSVDYDSYVPIERYDESLYPAFKLIFTIRDTILPPMNHAAKRVVDELPGVWRVYDFEFVDTRFSGGANYLTLMFNDLSMVSDFADWAFMDYGIRIDMAQIEAKENFKTFNILAIVLCVAIMILSVLFVTIFLWFLIDSHFRAISKNLGTIMAFGLPNHTIIRIYRTVFLRMVLYSLGVAVILLGVTELVLSYFSVVREGGMHYIILNDAWVWALIVIIPILTTIVVTFTMRGKLKAKPGDLIFERNN